MIRKLQLTE